MAKPGMTVAIIDALVKFPPGAIEAGLHLVSDLLRPVSRHNGRPRSFLGRAAGVDQQMTVFGVQFGGALQACADLEFDDTLSRIAGF